MGEGILVWEGAKGPRQDKGRPVSEAWPRRGGQSGKMAGHFGFKTQEIGCHWTMIYSRWVIID